MRLGHQWRKSKVLNKEFKWEKATKKPILITSGYRRCMCYHLRLILMASINETNASLFLVISVRDGLGSCASSAQWRIFLQGLPVCLSVYPLYPPPLPADNISCCAMTHFVTPFLFIYLCQPSSNLQLLFCCNQKYKWCLEVICLRDS